jgi:hypothetical protein
MMLDYVKEAVSQLVTDSDVLLVLGRGLGAFEVSPTQARVKCIA